MGDFRYIKKDGNNIYRVETYPDSDVSPSAITKFSESKICAILNAYLSIENNQTQAVYLKDGIKISRET